MKRFSFILSILTLLVSGCSQDENLEQLKSSETDWQFSTSFEQVNSRTYIEEGNLLRWTEGDQISLFKGNTLNCQYLFDGKTGDNSGTFSRVDQSFGTGNDLTAHYAVYPYASDIKITEKGVITATLNAEQNYAENSFGLGANTMVAVTENLDDTFLAFKNVGGYLKLQLYGEDVTVKTITLTGNNNEKLAGKATITSVYGEAPTISMAEDATESITLNCGEGVKIGTTAETATAFWMVVPPTTFEKGFTIKIANTANVEFVKSTSNHIVVERNVIKPMAAIKLEPVLVPFPDISGMWVIPMFSSNYQLQTLTLDRITDTNASYELSPGYGANSVGIFMGRDKNGKIELWINLSSPYGGNFYGGGVFNEDFTVVTGTHRVITNSVGYTTQYDTPWTIYRPNN